MNPDGLVSVIVTTKNEGEVIDRLLKSIKMQTHRDIELIVVDNASVDKTVSIARHFTDKVFNFGPERSAQRNYGAKKAKGKYLLFLDADMKLSPGVIASCVSLVEKDRKMAGAAILEDSVATNFWERVKAFERSFYNLAGDELTDAARFFKKEIFLKVGGYDQRITGPEDWDLTERLKRRGHKIGLATTIIFHYERIPSLFNLLKKKYYYALRLHRYLNKQKIPLISPKTIYFLRPVFYKNWKRLLVNPILSVSMFGMLILEMCAGGIGYLIGKARSI